MKVSIILGHPHEGSFNHAIAQRSKQTLLENGYEVFYHDLYHDNFNPVILHEEIPEDGTVDPVIRKHCHEISESDGIIIVHPNWWGQPPAILKGWIDRVMRPGVAYKFEEGDKGEGIPIGLLKAKAALVFNTSNTFEERELQVFGDPLERIWRDCVFGLCGVKTFYRKTYRVIVTSTFEERSEWLKDASDIVSQYFPLISVDER
ncbi:MAG: NAD(P)H-dependent oxidoreductase [Dehalococcoidia bacterium]|nr:NAD(P)H-dependent oxidoreductase [Dehalococcoidia bacterium]